MDERLEELAGRLEAISAELDDVALDVLREAAGSGATRRPDLEKRLTQARRAVDKAAHLLRGERD